MADAYQYLTDSERVTFNETSRLMQLSDWPSFSEAMSGWLDVTQDWIRERRAYIQDLATGEVDNGNGPGWHVAHRQERYDYLHKANHSNAAPHEVCQLPTDYLMDSAKDPEKVYASLREMWWMEPSSAYAAQSERRQACTDWLVARRKYIWRCAEGEVAGVSPGWDRSNRAARYEALQVATKAGSGYADWCETHNPANGEPLGGGGSGSSSAREKALSWMASHRGLYEDPSGSNCDNRSDGIRAAQNRCASWVVGEPWCGTWCFNAMRHAGVAGLSSNIASVEWVESQARAKKPPFTGWTTDGANAKPGDLVVLFSSGQHVGMVREVQSSNAIVEEGNTSDTSAKRTRSRSSDVIGYAKVAYP